VIVGAATTVRDAVLLVAPGPLSLELIGPVVLFCVPEATPVTFTEKMQDPFAASVPPERLMTLVPAVAVIDPVHVVLKPLGVDTTSPAGRVSLNEIPVNWNAFGLVTVKLKLVVPPTAIVAWPKALLIDGGRGGLISSTAFLTPEMEAVSPATLLVTMMSFMMLSWETAAKKTS
jgi:hypothetical protein